MPKTINFSVSLVARGIHINIREQDELPHYKYSSYRVEVCAWGNVCVCCRQEVTMYVFAVGKKLRGATYIETGAMEKRPGHKQRLQNMCSYLQLVMGFWVKQFIDCLNSASWHGCWYCHSLGSLLCFTDIHNWNCMWHLVRMSKNHGFGGRYWNDSMSI